MSAPDLPESSGIVGSAGAASTGSGAIRDRREVPTLVRLAGFGAALVAVFGGTVLIGGQIGPIGDPAAAEHTTDHPAEDAPPEEGHEGMDEGMDEGTGEGMEEGSGDGGSAVAELPGGLQISDGGYTLVPVRTVVPAGDRAVAFRIEGSDGAAVTDYDIEHERELHLIAVRRDFTGFQHVHPERATDGTWMTRLDLTGGTWRIFADFTPDPVGEEEPQPLTLGTDLTVTGPSGRMAGNGPSTVRIDTVDGYTVELAGVLEAGEDSDLSFAVTKGGAPVADLQPYLGARGHLVALREGDLAYLHVHPTDGENTIGNKVGFAANIPSVGGYRLFLDFRVDGVVRTASFILPAAGSFDAVATGSSGDGDGADGG
jgi:hypothetical protein